MGLLSNIYKSVPGWNAYYPSLSEATPEQKKFYNYLLKNFKKSNFIDIKGNLSYIFVYIYSVIEDFIRGNDINHLLYCFEKIKRGYSNYEKISSYLVYWASDACLYLNNYDRAWEVSRKICIYEEITRLKVSDFINIRAKCSDTSVDGQDLLRMLGKDNRLTNFGINHKDRIIELATIFLKDFHKDHGKNLIEYFCSQFNFSNLTENDFLKLKEFYPNEKDFSFWKKIYERSEKEKYPYKYGYYLFSGVPRSHIVKSEYKTEYETIKDINIEITYPSSDRPCMEFEAIPDIITVALKNKAKMILRECENTVREEINLPRVGEGWINETELFYKILEAFPNEKVTHHGRPAWLFLQHLDIYFPLKNIGIEYQGAQHQNPVEYFGGEKAFEKQQKLDRRKSQICRKNGCKLLYVYEGYDFKFIREEIKNIINNNSH